MPLNKTHSSIDRNLLGRSYNPVHRTMDRPSQWLGKNHRVLYHDPLSVAIIATFYYPFNAKAILSGLVHLVTDWICKFQPIKTIIEYLINR